MSINRRDFLRKGAAGIGVFSTSALVPTWITRSAQAIIDRSGEDRVLVILQLEGGNDSLNTLVPFEDADYYIARQTLAIPKNTLLPFAIDGLNAFNPNLSDLAGWYNNGDVAIIQNVGYPNPNLSHFVSTDFWEQGRVPGGPAVGFEGWMGRAVDQNALGAAIDPLMMAGAGHSRIPGTLKGTVYSPPAIRDEASYRIVGTDDPVLSAGAKALIGGRRLADIHALNDVATVDPLMDFVQSTSNVAEASIDIVQNLPSDASLPVTYPDTKLGRDLRLCSKLIRTAAASPRVLHVRQGGYDTHANQDVDHPGLLGDLNDALHAFLTDMALSSLMDRVLAMTFSEFGRRVFDNASGGTDHGAASLLFVMGSRVQGGIYGGQPQLESGQLQKGNLVEVFDFRNVFSEILADWFLVNPIPVFGQSWDSIGFLQSADPTAARAWSEYR